MSKQLFHHIQQTPETNAALYSQLIVADTTDDTEIRLLRIKCAKNAEDEICCHLETMSIKQAQQCQYLALSYACGDMSVTTKITVNDQVFRVTTNLAVGLRTIRSNWSRIASSQGLSTVDNDLTTGLIWVDALCIDQGNEEERS
jgi:hypothetical protein